MGPVDAVKFAILDRLNEPVMPLGNVEYGWFVYITHSEGAGFEVAAVDAKDEAIHHVKLTLEEVD